MLWMMPLNTKKKICCDKLLFEIFFIMSLSVVAWSCGGVVEWLTRRTSNLSRCFLEQETLH